MPAEAADTAPLPAPRAAKELPSPSQAELLKRVEGAQKTLGDDTATEPTGTPGAAESPKGSSSTVDPKIIGGTGATLAEAPWMVQLHYFDDKGTADTSDDEGYFCGGTLVAPAKVLTAAHCAAGLDWTKHGTVIAGTTQLPDDTGLHGGTAVAVWRQWVSPTYKVVDGAPTGGDFAVLTLNQTLPYKTLQVTSSSDTVSYNAGTPAVVYGWGRTSSANQDISLTLKKATVPMRADSSCAAYYPGDFVAGQMACAGNPASGQDAGTVSPCNGDSGGPLVVNGRIAGVVSWGVKDCVTSGAYSVYGKTRSYAGALNARIDDTDLDFDGKADLFARTSAGTAYEYYSLGKSPWLGRRASLGDWGGVNLVRQADLNRDSYQDYLFRTLDGVLYWFAFDGVDSYVEHRVGSGWNAMKNLQVPGDLTGDALPDLIAQDSAGALWVYPGKGNGTFGSRVKVGTGWGVMTITGKGDYTDDGKADLLARDSSGVLWLYPGRQVASAPFGARVKVGTGWSYSAYVGTGDISGDGKADLVVKDSAGVLWLYQGRGVATAPFSARAKVGTGWGAFNLFG
ncbi:trypsin-like serine protease [Streptomyces rishiriensis]|uniref:trypsin-like serine protease n=1 Tax=Streptomyces rishiriensis TaxID=68264 RepID=UPI000D595C4B|nr:trypsin-like serine protease [Streptomyces rishiriensis]